MSRVMPYKWLRHPLSIILIHHRLKARSQPPQREPCGYVANRSAQTGRELGQIPVSLELSSSQKLGKHPNFSEK